MQAEKSKIVVIIVAHPDDETLWAGGTMLSEPSWNFFIVCLSRKNDPERSAKFHKALQILNAQGIMGDLDDGPNQLPLDAKVVEETLLKLVPQKHFDLVITHDPAGEYTRHLRHEEVSGAVIRLWNNGNLISDTLWTFAYEDGKKTYYPQPVQNVSFYRLLSEIIWQRKYRIITETYGFDSASWEAKTTPKAEAFREFRSPADAIIRLDQSANEVITNQ